MIAFMRYCLLLFRTKPSYSASLSALICLIILGMFIIQHTEAFGVTDPKMNLVFSEGFTSMKAMDRFHLNQSHISRTSWTIKNGRLHAQKAYNQTLWLTDPLPNGDWLIRFSAWTHSNDGDVKCEIFGDGIQHESGLILIMGGWKNTLNIIAQYDEHELDRRVESRCKDQRCIPTNIEQKWEIERRGNDVIWRVNGRLMLRRAGISHFEGDFFGLGNWQAPVSFDHLKIYRIAPTRKTN